MMSVQDLQRAKFIGAKNRAQGETLEMLIAMACGFYKAKEQADFLDEHLKMNALCFVVVSYGDVYAAVPWGDWKRMKEMFGHKYMTREESQKYRIGFNRSGILDFFG